MANKSRDEKYRLEGDSYYNVCFQSGLQNAHNKTSTMEPLKKERM